MFQNPSAQPVQVAQPDDSEIICPSWPLTLIFDQENDYPPAESEKCWERNPDSF